MSNKRVAVFEIKNYMVIWRQLEVREFANVTAPNSRAGALHGGGCGRGRNLPARCLFSWRTTAPYLIHRWISPTGAAPIFMSISDIHAFVDILRNEKPIYGHLREDNPQWTSVTTTK